MTKEQIIIDDVDVSECAYYADGKCTNSQMIQSNCKNVAVCYYKEYKRKEQECEELREKYLELKEKEGNLVVQLNTITESREQSRQNNKALEKENLDLLSQETKLRQALQEIKDYCNKYPQNSIGFKKQILQKCEEV